MKIVKILDENAKKTDTIFETRKKCNFKSIIKTWKKLNKNLKLNKANRTII